MRIGGYTQKREWLIFMNVSNKVFGIDMVGIDFGYKDETVLAIFTYPDIIYKLENNIELTEIDRRERIVILKKKE